MEHVEIEGPVEPEIEPTDLTDAESEFAAFKAKEDEPHIASAKQLLGAYQKSSQAMVLYPKHSAIRQEMLDGFGDRLLTHVEFHGETTFVVEETSLVYRDETIYHEESRQKSLAFRLYLSGVRRICFLPGIRPDEAVGVVAVMTRTFDPDTDQDDLRTLVWERCFDHVEFSIVDDLLDDEEQAAFAVFVRDGVAAPATAVEARREADETFTVLGDVDPPQDESPDAPFRLEPADLEALKVEAAEESDVDLLGELSDFLVDALEGPGGQMVHRELANFLEHMVTDGEIVRAARLLESLREAVTRRSDPKRRRLLHDALERVAKTRIVPCLRPLLPTLAAEDRGALVSLLVALGETAVPPLCDLLDDPDAREIAHEALEKLGPRHPHALLPFVQHPQDDVVRQVVTLLGVCGDPEVASGLVPAIRHDDLGIRREALRSLEKLGGRKVIDLFLTALGDPAYEVRSLALATLAEYREPKAARILIARVDDSKFLSTSEYEKRETFRTLGLIGSPQVLVKLIHVLKTKGSLFRRTKTDELRALAAGALSLVGSAAARNALLAHTKDRSELVRRAVATALKVLAKSSAGQGGSHENL